MASKKLSDFGIKVPKQMATPEVPGSQVLIGTQTMSSFAKWVPLICAGAAVGVSVLALKEIKNVRKELINLKKEQTSAPGASGPSAELTQKIELMDEQLRKITQYLANQNKQREQVVKAVVPPKEKVNIINETSPEEEVEYEEVTDDEAEAEN
jgi:hypothetical protein